MTPQPHARARLRRPAHGLRARWRSATFDPGSEALDDVERVLLRLAPARSASSRRWSVRAAHAQGDPGRASRASRPRARPRRWWARRCSSSARTSSRPPRASSSRATWWGSTAVDEAGEVLGKVEEIWHTGPVPNLVIRARAAVGAGGALRRRVRPDGGRRRRDAIVDRGRRSSWRWSPAREARRRGVMLPGGDPHALPGDGLRLPRARASSARRSERGLLSRRRRATSASYAEGKHRVTDDAPYGGGAGMVMKPEPLVAAHRGRAGRGSRGAQVLLMSPRGPPLHPGAGARAGAPRGRADPRLRPLRGRGRAGDAATSTGSCRSATSSSPAASSPPWRWWTRWRGWCPGCWATTTSAGTESFEEGLLEHPQYTRPPVFRGAEVPAVLQCGDHAADRPLAALAGAQAHPGAPAGPVRPPAALSTQDQKLLAQRGGGPVALRVLAVGPCACSDAPSLLGTARSLASFA